MAKKVFITGVAGFLGSHIADAFLYRGYEVVGIDNFIGGDQVNIPKGVDWRFYDCNNFGSVCSLMKGAELVYHCAATAYEGLSVFSPHIVNTNIMGASTAIFAAAAQCGVKRVVHCSSMARYGALVPPFRETMTPMPQDPYGVSKVAAEKMLKNLSKIHGFEYVIAVPHNIIGPRQKYDDPFRNVASIMINLVLQGRPPIIYGDGTQQRCFSYIDDCLACLTAMADQPLHGETINIGPDEEPVTINNLAGMVCNLCDRPDLVPVYVPGRPQEVKVALCSSDKARAVLGYRTKTTLAQGLTKMIEAIKATGTKPFIYHLPIEIESPKVPKTWTERLF